MTKYCYKLENGEYVIYRGNSQLLSPERNFVVKTKYEELAKRMVEDLEKYGNDLGIMSNIMSLYYSFTERFYIFTKEELEQSLIDKYLCSDDWYIMYGVSGRDIPVRWAEWSSLKGVIIEWLSKITMMQIAAVCCAAKAYESLYVAFCFAVLVEEHNGNVPDDKFWELFANFPVRTFCFNRNEFIADFKSFELFYSLHLKENGRTLKS